MMNLMIFLGDQEQIPWSAMEYVIGQVSPKAHVASQLDSEPSSSLSLALMSGQLKRCSQIWLFGNWRQPLTWELSLQPLPGRAWSLATSTSLVSPHKTCPGL